MLHGGLAHDTRVNITWIESERLKWPEAIAELERFDGILVPGGFGRRGVEGMLCAIRYAREFEVPYFGICLGMQTMVIEFARNVCGLTSANSTECDPSTPDRVIYKLRELKGVDELKGDHAAVGARIHACSPKIVLRAGPTARPKSANVIVIWLRVQPGVRIRAQTTRRLRLTGETPDGVYVEICRLPDHPWYLGCQFHPEFKSKPLEPHPHSVPERFIGAALEHHTKGACARKSTRVRITSTA